MVKQEGWDGEGLKLSSWLLREDEGVSRGKGPRTIWGQEWDTWRGVGVGDPYSLGFPLPHPSPDGTLACSTRR